MPDHLNQGAVIVAKVVPTESMLNCWMRLSNVRIAERLTRHHGPVLQAQRSGPLGKRERQSLIRAYIG